MPTSIHSASSLQVFRFFSLPLEVRRLIYSDYLSSIRTSLQELEESLVYDSILEETVKLELPLLVTCQQVYYEIKDLHKITSLAYRISWQDRRYDAWSSFLLKLHHSEPKLDFGNIPHLRILIYPAIDGRSTDMLHIWQRTKIVCRKLRGHPRIRSLYIEFRGDTRWKDKQGRPRDTLNFKPQSDICDITHILNLFATVTNVEKLAIILPDCLNDVASLEDARDRTIKFMTRQQQQNLTQDFEHLVLSMGQELCHREPLYKSRTAEWGFNLLPSRPGETKLTWTQLEEFLKTHPHLSEAECYKERGMRDVLVWPDCIYHPKFDSNDTREGSVDDDHGEYSHMYNYWATHRSLEGRRSNSGC
ncbi:MAG: hypothetical protein LQ343_003562 [Gyalolechia ehrenbergii]|nr:MAG: hypothetical protein LQ343_003562 [Gyalolechia ehrenbergii]